MEEEQDAPKYARITEDDDVAPGRTTRTSQMRISQRRGLLLIFSQFFSLLFFSSLPFPFRPVPFLVATTATTAAATARYTTINMHVARGS